MPFLCRQWRQLSRSGGAPVIALISLKPQQVLRTFNVEREAAVRVDLPDGSQLSPVTLGWTDGKYAVWAVEPFEAPESKERVGPVSYEFWDDVVREVYDVQDAPPPPRRMVPKWLIVARLTDQQLEQAIGLMTVRQQERWRAAAFPDIYADDPEMVAILTYVGADAEHVLRAGEDV